MYIITEILTTQIPISMELLLAILGSLTTIFVTFIGIYSKRIDSKIKSIKILSTETIGKLTNVELNVRNNAEQNKIEHIKIFSKLNNTCTVTEKILKIKTVNEEIDNIVSNHLEYLYDNKEAMSYLVHKSSALKEFVGLVIESDFKLTCKWIKAKLDDLFLEVHSRDKFLNERLLLKLKPTRDKLEKEFKIKITQILTDELINSTEDRFKRAIVYFLDQQAVHLVRIILKDNKQ